MAATREALREAEERLRAVADLVHEWEYWISPEGTLRFCSPSCERVTGYGPEEFIQDPGLLQRIILPEDRPGFENHCAEFLHSIEQPTSPPINFRIVTRSGEVRWIAHVCKAAIASDGRHLGRRVSNRDITEHRRLEGEIRQQLLLMRIVADAIPSPLFIKDSRLLYTGCNQAFAEFVGQSRESILGKTSLELFPDDLGSRYHSKDTELLDRRGQHTYETQLRTSDGTIHDVLISKATFNGPDGRLAGLVGVVQDITERKRTQATITASENLYRSLVRNLGEGVGLLDEDERFAFANPAAEKIFGWPPGTLIGRSLKDLIPPGQVEVLERQRANRRRGMTHSYELRIVRLDGQERHLEVTAVAEASKGSVNGTTCIFRDFTDQRREREQLSMLRIALEAAADAVVVTDIQGRIEWVNDAFTHLTGYTLRDVAQRTPAVLKSGQHSLEFYQQLWSTIKAGNVWQGEIVNRRKDGVLYHEEMTITPVRNAARQLSHFIAVKRNIDERKRAENERAQMEVQLRHAQKLESIGQLAAGIAHEINTPTQYIGDNTRFLQDAFQGLSRLLTHYDKLRQAAQGGSIGTDVIQAVNDAIRNADLDYVLDEVPTAIRQCIDGVDRVSRIVRAMKEFSHPGSEEKTPIDLNRAIESTVTVSRNEWKYVADLGTDLDPNLPPVPCHPGEVNQVILNLIVNAAHAIAEMPPRADGTKGRIRVITRHEGDFAEVRVEDTGTGIPEAIRGRVFDPFFTTKAVGKGTGQGLAIAHSVVVDKHGGTISFETELGRGTTFIVRLPLTQSIRRPETP